MKTYSLRSNKAESSRSTSWARSEPISSTSTSSMTLPQATGRALRSPDPRFQALVTFLTEKLRSIGTDWSNWRREGATDEARKYASIDKWYTRLKPDQKKRAKQLFGKIATITVDSEEQRREMYKHGILAFERLVLSGLLDELDSLGDESVESFLPGVCTARRHRGVAVLGGRSNSRGKLSSVSMVSSTPTPRSAFSKSTSSITSGYSTRRGSAPPRTARWKSASRSPWSKLTQSLSDEERAARLDIQYRSARRLTCHCRIEAIFRQTEGHGANRPATEI